MGIRASRIHSDIHCLLLRCCIMVIVFFGTSAIAAEASPPASDGTNFEIPAPLQPWGDWVRYQQEYRRCPLIHVGTGDSKEDFLCAWPGELSLEVNEHGGHFEQYWWLEARSVITLPGSTAHWPQAVRVNDQPFAVLEVDGRPVVDLPAGRHTVSGRFQWQTQPLVLAVPESVALIKLQLADKRIRPVQRDAQGVVLGTTAAAAQEKKLENSMDIQIFRKYTDAIPGMLTTRLQFRVSGEAREIELTPLLPEGFIPIELTSAWPVRLDDKARLWVQVQPGQANLTVVARANTPLEQLLARLPDTLDQEVWSYEANPVLRTTLIKATENDNTPLAVDPQQAGVPKSWQHLPAFAMANGSSLQIEEQARGLSDQDGQRLRLQREMWLDFSGSSFFARDRIDGQMMQGWRLDIAHPYTLERADGLGIAKESLARMQQTNASAANLLVTQGREPGLTGVEWRRPRVTLNAGVRLNSPANAHFAATGWQQSFDEVNTRLHLPYGYKLIAAPGTDRALNSWLASWTILDLFFAALIAFLAYQQLGLIAGFATAAYLALAFPETGAPIWTLACVLILTFIRKTLPHGRLRKLFRLATLFSLIVLSLLTIKFAPPQIRAAFYPQLEEALPGAKNLMHYSPPTAVDRALDVESAASEEIAEKRSSLTSNHSSAPVVKMARPSAQTTENYLAQNVAAIRQRYGQMTVNHTGRGEPNWQLGSEYDLRWFGPVTAEQQLHLIISPPWLTRLLRLCMVALLGLLIWQLFRSLSRPCAGRTAAPMPQDDAASPVSGTGGLSTMLSILLVIAGLGLGMTPPAQADGSTFPPPQLLNELKNRLNEPPECASQCADIATAEIMVEDGRLNVFLQVHAGTRVALPLPSPEQNLSLTSVALDGKDDQALVQRDGVDYLAVPRGVHHLVLHYTLSGNSSSLQFPLIPKRIQFAGEGWQSEGIHEQQLLERVLRFSRNDTSSTNADGTPPPARELSLMQQFPPYVQVVREVFIGLDWLSQTQVNRVAPKESEILVDIPLLPGEHVTSAEVRVHDNKAKALLRNQVAAISWQGRVDKNTTLTLTAPPLAQHSEVWRIEVDPSWHMEWQGVPVSLPQENTGEQVFEFHPLPGETLTLSLSQPQAAQGMFRAIDGVELRSEFGNRASTHTLSFSLRAGQGGEHVLSLPSESTEIITILRNNETLNLHPHDGKLTLPVSPGSQSYTITLRDNRPTSMIQHSLAADLGLEAANVKLDLNLSSGRWILASSGPGFGPAVLYWGELLTALLLAWLVSRSPHSPLRFYQWLLLVLGFSTFSWLGLGTVAAWLFALDWRGRSGSLLQWSTRRFNFMQIGLVLLSIVAFFTLLNAVEQGLLSTPNMGVSGLNSHNYRLTWILDRSPSALPPAVVISLPLWVYRLTMLAWSLWLAQALVRWMRHGAAAWIQGGYWRRFRIFRKK